MGSKFSMRLVSILLLNGRILAISFFCYNGIRKFEAFEFYKYSIKTACDSKFVDLNLGR